VVGLSRSVLQTSSNVPHFKIRIVLQDFLFGHSGSKQIENVHNADTQPPNAGSPAALFWIERNSIPIAHTFSIKAVMITSEPIFLESFRYFHHTPSLTVIPPSLAVIPFLAVMLSAVETSGGSSGAFKLCPPDNNITHQQAKLNQAVL
jgi:hypothetical protein